MTSSAMSVFFPILKGFVKFYQSKWCPLMFLVPRAWIKQQREFNAEFTIQFSKSPEMGGRCVGQAAGSSVKCEGSPAAPAPRPGHAARCGAEPRARAVLGLYVHLTSGVGPKPMTRGAARRGARCTRPARARERSRRGTTLLLRVLVREPPSARRLSSWDQ